MDLGEAANAARGREGTVWTLEESEDLNANLIRFSPGGGVGEHTNEEVDIILVGIAGVGSVMLGGEECRLSAGEMVFVPRGVSRGIRSHSEDFAYLSVHRRRGPLKLQQSLRKNSRRDEVDDEASGTGKVGK